MSIVQANYGNFVQNKKARRLTDHFFRHTQRKDNRKTTLYCYIQSACVAKQSLVGSFSAGHHSFNRAPG